MNAGIYAEKEVPTFLQDRSQRYCLLSVTGPEGCGQKSDNLTIRFYGCRETKQDANKWARKLEQKTGHFDVLSVQCNEWFALPPRMNAGSNEERGNEERVDDVFEQYKSEELANKEQLKRQLDKDTRVEHPRPEKPLDLDIGAVLAAEDKDSDDSATHDVSVSVPQSVRDKHQQWTVVSVVAPQVSAPEKAEMALRVYGSRERLQDAEDWAKQLRESNPYFHVFVVENCIWGTLPPRLDKVSNVNSSDAVIQQLHDSYKQEEIARRKDQAKELEAMHAKSDESEGVLSIQEDTSTAATAAAAAAAAEDTEGTEESKESG